MSMYRIPARPAVWALMMLLAGTAAAHAGPSEAGFLAENQAAMDRMIDRKSVV